MAVAWWSRVVECLGIAVAVSAAACAQQEERIELPSCYVPVRESPTRGPSSAWVTIVEFGDFECPYCGQVEATIQSVDAARPSKVRWVWKQFPLSFHPRAVPDAIAAECAYAQGRFWEMHDLLFAHQDAQSDSDVAAYAQQIGLDAATWQLCLNSAPPQQRILTDENDATSASVQGTPTFFINGVALVGAAPESDFISAIDSAEQTAMQSGLSAQDYYASHEGQGCQ